MLFHVYNERSIVNFNLFLREKVFGNKERNGKGKKKEKERERQENKQKERKDKKKKKQANEIKTDGKKEEKK